MWQSIIFAANICIPYRYQSLVPCYQPPRNNFFHLAIVFKFVAANILLPVLQTDDSRSVKNIRDTVTIRVGSLATELQATRTCFSDENL
jgi:hypothetical protein